MNQGEQILSFLGDGEPRSVAEIETGTGIVVTSLRQQLSKLKKKGLLESDGRGVYHATGTMSVEKVDIPAGDYFAKVGDLTPHNAAKVMPALSQTDRKRLKQSIERDGVTHPIDVTPHNEILDGVNRWRIAEKLGLEKIPARVYLYQTDEEREAHAIKVNLARRHLDTAQRKTLARQLLKLSPEKSDRRIAAETKLSPKTVGTERKELEAREEIPQVKKRTDTKGRKQPAKPKATKAKPKKRKKITFKEHDALERELVNAQLDLKHTRKELADRPVVELKAKNRILSLDMTKGEFKGAESKSLVKVYKEMTRALVSRKLLPMRIQTAVLDAFRAKTKAKK